MSELAEQEVPKIQEVPCESDDGQSHIENKTFIINEEDHTLGNVLRFVINKYPETDFVGLVNLLAL